MGCLISEKEFTLDNLKKYKFSLLDIEYKEFAQAESDFIADVNDEYNIIQYSEDFADCISDIFCNRYNYMSRTKLYINNFLLELGKEII